MSGASTRAGKVVLAAAATGAMLVGRRTVEVGEIPGPATAPPR